MLRFCAFATLLNSTICCILISAVLSIPPPTPFPPPICIDGEVLSYCYNSHCFKRYCVEQEPEPDCKLSSFCLPGCLCKEGYLRAQNGTCVPHDKCPTPIICGENEIYSRCVNNACFKMNCSQTDTSKLCPDHIFDGECVEGCMCTYDYLRADDGTCIPANECPKKCPGPNEYFGCKLSCDNVCPTLTKTNQTECTTNIGLCVDKCYCDEGYARDANNICIPITDCPKERTKRSNAG